MSACRLCMLAFVGSSRKTCEESKVSSVQSAQTTQLRVRTLTHLVDDDLDFAVGEVAVRTPLRLRLRRTGREEEERGDSDEQRQEALDEEHPVCMSI